MNIEFVVSLNYGEDGPSENEPTPAPEEIAKWVMQGMAKDGFTSADVSAVAHD